ncbi:CDP-alcohol phosphatidyltransferase family protein [Pseudotabrizicola sp. L79]|uniref:CDP-alcohol phosphatidyltransferase family protein n=1 Tax=Pseudotabrizicola sp. L79 TaxID=3118402 RepID=UPI002F95A0B6
MFDAKIRPWIDPPLNRLGRGLARAGVSADAVTLAGLGLGLGAALWLALGGAGWIAAVLILGGRLADGLDGAVARATTKTDFGGYLDIFCDFIFYAAIPLAFVLRDPGANAVAGAFLIGSFYVNAASFLGYAVLAEKRGMQTEAQGQKSLYYAAGLLEGAETIVLFVLISLLPGLFVPAAVIFGGLCLITAVARVVLARQVFQAGA